MHCCWSVKQRLPSGMCLIDSQSPRQAQRQRDGLDWSAVTRNSYCGWFRTIRLLLHVGRNEAVVSAGSTSGPGLRHSGSFPGSSIDFDFDFIHSVCAPCTNTQGIDSAVSLTHFCLLTSFTAQLANANALANLDTYTTLSLSLKQCRTSTFWQVLLLLPNCVYVH